MLLLAVAPGRLGASVVMADTPGCCSTCDCCLQEASGLPHESTPVPPARSVSIDPFPSLNPVEVVVIATPSAEAEFLPDRFSVPFSEVPLFQRYCLLLI